MGFARGSTYARSRAREHSSRTLCRVTVHSSATYRCRGCTRVQYASRHCGPHWCGIGVVCPHLGFLLCGNATLCLSPVLPCAVWLDVGCARVLSQEDANF